MIKLEFFADEKEGYEKALYEIHVERCRNIQRHIESEIGYNVEATIRKCMKKKNMMRRKKQKNVWYVELSFQKGDRYVMNAKKAGEWYGKVLGTFKVS